MFAKTLYRVMLMSQVTLMSFQSTLYPGRVVTSRLQTAGRGDQNSSRSAVVPTCILTGWTSGSENGNCAFEIGFASGHSVIDCYISSTKCTSAVQSLCVLEDANCHTDHFPVQLHVACGSIVAATAGLPFAPSEPRIRDDAEKADDYQKLLVAELQKHWLPLVQRQVDVDLSAKVLWWCIRVAARKTIPLAHTWRGAPARMSKPWYDQACRDARPARQTVHDCPNSTDELRLLAEKQYESVISRSKKSKSVMLSWSLQLKRTLTDFRRHSRLFSITHALWG